VRVAHLTVELGFRHQRGHRIDNQHVNGSRANQRFSDLQRLFARVGLRDEQIVDVDAQLFRVAGIERVLGIDKGCQSARTLRLGNDL
jgi:hypothetical protein